MSLERQEHHIWENTKVQSEYELISLWIKNEKKLQEYLKTYHGIDMNSFDATTKKKFLYEMDVLFSELKNYKPGMEENLKNIREEMSMWLESGKNKEFYRSLILWNKIHARITILKEVLRVIQWENLDEKDKKIKTLLDKIHTSRNVFTQWFWIQYLWSITWNGYEELEKIYADKLVDIENMSEADLVILLRVLFSIVPIAGDAVWGMDDLRQARWQMNYDGSIHGFWENMFFYLIWSLWISIVGGRVATLSKWPKLAKAFLKIEQIISKLSQGGNIEKLSKNKNFIQLLEKMKGKIPWVEWLLWKLLKTSQIWKLTNEIISKLNNEELIHYILKNNIEKIDISSLSGNHLARINQILTQNFPLLEISRLVSWDKLVNVNISGIKQINDIAGADFCDKVIWKFKEILKSQFAKSSQNKNHKWRIVKDDYKNITFETNSNNPLQTIFWNTSSKQEIIDYMLTSLEKDIEKNARNILTSQVKKWEISVTSQKHFEELIIQKTSQTKLVILRYFDFWVWESIIPKNAHDIEKLDAIRQAEVSSRAGNIKTDTITLKEYSSNDILSNLKKSLEMEQSIIEKFKWKKFRFEWVDYNIVFYKNGKATLSTEALRYIRKYPDKITPKELSNMLQSYLNNLNSSLDFISPVKDELKNGGNEFEIARQIDKQIKSWVIDTRFLIQSYKWWMTKSAFFKNIEWKTGTKIFIDIKDMWIDNLVDFNLRAKQIVKLSEDLQVWKIDQKTFDAQQRKILLESGKSVSDKFIEIQKRIQTKYPNAFISFWWDEIYLFIENTPHNILTDINTNLTQIFNSTNQKARIVIDPNTKTPDSKRNFAQLEKITKLNKILEEAIEKQLTKKWLNLNGNIPENTYIHIHENIREKILSPGFHMDDFFSEIKSIIEQKDVVGTKTKQLYLWKTSSGIDIHLKKSANNEIEIYLNNSAVWTKK